MEDRRVRRTRRTLQRALIALMRERGYRRLTVQDILERADIGRSTFYAHFRDKDALLLSSFEDLAGDLRAAVDALEVGRMPDDPAHPSTALFAHAYQHQDIYRAVCGQAVVGTLVERYLHDTISAVLRGHLGPHLDATGSALPADLVSEFATSALVGSLMWWVAQDFPHDPVWMARAYGSLANPGVMAAVSAGHQPQAAAHPHGADRGRP